MTEKVFNDIVFEYDSEGCDVKAGHPDKDFIKTYIQKYDKDFYIPLSQRVDMESFAQKLSDLSTTFVVLKDGNVAGLICSYFYQPETKKGFITLVHTKHEYRGQHLSVILLDALKQYAIDNGFDFVDLFVSKQQTAAYNLYLKHGFEVLEEGADGRCLMRWNAKN